MLNLSPLNQSPNSQVATTPLQLLVLSNGHGEDIISIRILRELQKLSAPPDIFALPLVGEGIAYQELAIPVVGSVRKMPSGGFIYMDGRQLMGDVRGGLLQLTFKQIQAVRRWVSGQKKSGQRRAILAVGDIVPLLFAAMSGANYAFVGTAKSEYYVRDEFGLLARSSSSAARWENFSGSIYHPWERWLMGLRRCRAVFPRDSLTAEILRKGRLPVFDLGNPMMDDLTPTFTTQQFYSAHSQELENDRPLMITLLPGSRSPEAYSNWDVITVVVSALMASFREGNAVCSATGTVVFLGAIAPGLDCQRLAETLRIRGWRPIDQSCLKLGDPHPLVFKQKTAELILTQRAYNDCLHLGDLAIAMAGTATEQFVGLGKPAIAIPGTGPQYNPAFAEAQSRLLGPSLILVNQSAQVPPVVQSLLKNPDYFQLIAENGFKRMGSPGASKRIAECLEERLNSK
jgi:uncharacterized protein (TIGR03492 family)